MARLRKIVIPWTTIFSDLETGTGEFNPCTAWGPAPDVQLARITFEVRNTTDSNGIVYPAFETADVPDSPTTTIFPSGGADPTRNDKTGNGVSFPQGMTGLAGSTAGKQLIRFGFYFKASAASLKCARVSGVVEWEDCG
ncbi:hypothetical protein HY631_04370 [Candidatus Uhrbacteria bacterium]|nr:hypothetical protein [Candidatus Uhrbacteria bacterium]